MRVLQLPVNYGSLPSHTVRMLRAGGVDAHGLVFSKSIVQSAENMTLISDYGANAPQKLLNRGRWFANVLNAIVVLRPDIIHWYFGKSALPLGVDLALVNALDIPRLVEWQGSDIRIPDQEAAENSYFAAAWRDAYEYANVESRENSLARQKRFAQAGFFSAAPVGMLQYIDKSIFHETYTIPQRMIVEDYAPAYPDPTQRKPLIVHSPTAPVAKGTKAVLGAIESLKGRYDFDFQLIQGLPRAEALRLMQRADIFLDQFVWGDRGMASLEALAYGKPVVCYIKPSLVALYPADNPIVNATQEMLSDVLAQLISDGKRRHELGRQGRHFVEREYAPEKVRAEVLGIYTDVIRRT